MPGKVQAIKEPPNELKSIKPFILRGNQLRAADPIITYYCYFWAIKHILGNSLHSTTPECTSWTTDLMDELENRKAILGSNELIHDDIAAQAYVENFALKIFNNGAAVVESGKATGQTSDTLLAGATLLEVCKVFGDLDTETLQKIKYAKFHAARIWKALSAGQDPNPLKPETPEIEEEDPRGPPPDIYGNEPSHPPPPTIEEVPDEYTGLEPKFARASIYDEPLHDSRQSPAPQSFPAPQQPPATQQFPTPQQSPTPQQDLSNDLPSPPQFVQFFQPEPAPSAPSLFQPPKTYNLGPVEHYPASNNPFQQPMQTSVYQRAQQAPPPVQQQHHFQYVPPPVQRVAKEVTPEDMTKAQKHARWAVSALDYEDVETAIKQFRLGLQMLGVED